MIEKVCTVVRCDLSLQAAVAGEVGDCSVVGLSWPEKPGQFMLEID